MNEFIKLLILLSSSNGILCSTENESDSFVDIEDSSYICFGIEACQSECCQQYYLYSVAKKKCTTNIDGQLASVKWYSPFSKVYHQFWQSKCGEINGSKWETDQLGYAAKLANDSEACKNFDQHCLDYTNRFVNFTKCIPPDDGTSWIFSFKISAVIVSITLQVFTLLLFLAVPELMKGIRDQCFLFYQAARVIESVIYLISEFFEPTLSDSYCYLLAFGSHFSGLAVYFWFNVLCIQIWRSIKTLTTSNGSPKTILCHYSLYAFGCSLAVTVITYLADRWLSDDSPFKPIREPFCATVVHNYALGSAWFQPTFIYYYSIAMILLIIDTGAFLDIARTILAREKRFSGTEDELRRHQKNQLGISTYLKLIVLMGTMNLLNVIIFLFSHTTTLNTITMLLSYLNGLFVWLIVVCRKQVFHAVRRRFFKLANERVLSGRSNISEYTLTTKLSGHNSGPCKSQS